MAFVQSGPINPVSGSSAYNIKDVQGRQCVFGARKAAAHLRIWALFFSVYSLVRVRRFLESRYSGNPYNLLLIPPTNKKNTYTLTGAMNKYIATLPLMADNCDCSHCNTSSAFELSISRSIHYARKTNVTNRTTGLFLYNSIL